VRFTVEQNIVLRWVSEADLPALHDALVKVGLGEPGAGTILDITACPGTDTCKLGISSSRGLAGELRERLAATAYELDEAIRGLRIKVSGCFNSCGQHHVADIGFFGNSRKIGGHAVPHFQVVLGGKWQDNAGAFGLAIGSIPSKRIPEVVDRITSRYVADREPGESFQDFCGRIGKQELAETIAELKPVPPHELDASLYSDWGDPASSRWATSGSASARARWSPAPIWSCRSRRVSRSRASSRSRRATSSGPTSAPTRR
jgi:Sulfite reductase, beta subunit (hemoprotein)